MIPSIRIGVAISDSHAAGGEGGIVAYYEFAGIADVVAGDGANCSRAKNCRRVHTAGSRTVSVLW